MTIYPGDISLTRERLSPGPRTSAGAGKAVVVYDRGDPSGRLTHLSEYARRYIVARGRLHRLWSPIGMLMRLVEVVGVAVGG